MKLPSTMHLGGSARVVASIVTSNYISQAMVTYSYLQETNPDTPYFVLIVGERSAIESKLPIGPCWMFWDELVDEADRTWLASDFLPFELSCVLRGRLHKHLASQPEIERWAVIDTDIGVLSSLDPLFDALDDGPIALTLHSTEPIGFDRIVPQESNLLGMGLYNGGVVAMRHSEEAVWISQWLCERLEKYGRSWHHRQWQGLEAQSFEFVDQIWLNLIPVYCPSTVIIRDERINLGHWNLFQGQLEVRDGSALFKGKPVVMIHFSGLPKDRLDFVAAHDSIYRERPSQAWAELASEYLRRLEISKEKHLTFPYCYSEIQPCVSRDQAKSAPLNLKSTAAGFPKRAWQKIVRGVQSPGTILGVINKASWKIKRSCKVALSILINRSEDQIFRDRSGNAFTDLVPCIGNYESYLVRASILQAVVDAKSQFHGKLLDVGAGSSPYEELIMGSGKVSEYIKLDFASSDYHQGHDLDLTWDGTTIPLDANTIDTVFMTEVLEHVHKPGEILGEVRRVLKPGGIFFLTVPFLWPMHELPYDYHRFTPIALRAYLEEAGFHVNGIQMLGGWHYSFAAQIGLWLSNGYMSDRKRKLAKLLAWPLYSYLIRKGKNEPTQIRNHQMYVGLAAVASTSHPGKTC